MCSYLISRIVRLQVLPWFFGIGISEDLRGLADVHLGQTRKDRSHWYSLSKCFSFSPPALTLKIHSMITKQSQLNVMRLSSKPYRVVIWYFKALRRNSDNCLYLMLYHPKSSGKNHAVWFWKVGKVGCFSIMAEREKKIRV